MSRAVKDLSRRSFVSGGLCGCACLAAGTDAFARVLPSNLTSHVGKGYQPADTDERGLWQACDRIEDALSASNLIVTEPALNAYVRSITEKMLGDSAHDLRIFIMRDPNFNASMMPNGMMILQTGLLARMRNEAQLASVIGHEAGHYLRRHSLQGWRDRRTKSAIMSVVALAGAAASGSSGNGGWSDLANAVNNVLLLSLFQFNRDQEAEADAYGLMLMSKARYRLQASSETWSQLIEERKASAAARKKAYKDRASSVLSTHPPSADRMRDLEETASELERKAGAALSADDGKAQWQAALAPHRPMLLDEQVKLNDPGASLYLINTLSLDGWDGTLRYYEGEAYRLRDEAGDTGLAAESYAAALTFADAPPQAHRAHGYAQLKAGNVEEGKRSLTRYLELNPNAADAAMVRFSLAQ